MEHICIYPGSFDPITVGHMNIIERASVLYDQVIVTVLRNPEKKTMFSLSDKLELICQCCASLKNVKVDSYDGLLADYARKYEHPVILRGIRDFSDWTAETKMAALNRRLYPGLETIFLQSDPQLICVSSSAVKEIALYGGDIAEYIPGVIYAKVAQKLYHSV